MQPKNHLYKFKYIIVHQKVSFIVKKLLQRGSSKQ